MYLIACAGLLAFLLYMTSATVWAGMHITPKWVHAHTRAPIFTYRLMQVYPHRRDAFTQGLVIDAGMLYESTGRYGQSRLMRIDLTSGTVEKNHHLPSRFFGEGITILGDRLFQLTYKSQIGLVYDKADFRQLQIFHYVGQGWGLTTDGRRLIMSNGSAQLIFIDPISLKQIGQVTVVDGNREIIRLNELEWHGGRVYANIWQTDLIAIIDSDTGQVTGWIDLSGLNPDPATLQGDYVLNGIAAQPLSPNLLVTGKCWPWIYEIQPVEIQHE